MAFKINDYIPIEVDLNGVQKTYQLNYKKPSAYEEIKRYIASMESVKDLKDPLEISQRIVESSKSLIDVLLDGNAWSDIFENRINDVMDLQAFVTFLFNQIQEDKKKTLKEYGI